MEKEEFMSKLEQLQKKLERGRVLSHDEQILMLAGMLLGKTTRKEQDYR